MQDTVVIVGAKRTPMGNFQGNLSSISATELGSTAIKGAFLDSGISQDDVNEVLMGCVLPAGLGQAPARQAALGAGFPESVGCTTINKVCGSGMRTIMLAADSILAGNADMIVAGGMESMSNAPYILEKARSGYRMGHGRLLDHMFYDGLEDAYQKGWMMARFADETADEYVITRKEQDAFAVASGTRALQADGDGYFESEIVPVEVEIRKETSRIFRDEIPSLDKIAKIPKLKPINGEGGTITAANASSITDGAAAVVLTRKSIADAKELEIKGVIRGYTTHSQQPYKFTTAPIGAMRKLSQKVGWELNTVDLFEINEAFAMVVLAAMKEFKLPHEKVNIYGGACALGHPIGASGTRIVVTLLNALKQTGKTRGIASLCIGGGEATAIAIERS